MGHDSRRLTSGDVVNEHPSLHEIRPLDLRACEIDVHFRNCLLIGGRFGTITLENRSSAELATVTFPVALFAVRTHNLEIGPEGMAAEPGNPILEFGSFLFKERNFEMLCTKCG